MNVRCFLALSLCIPLAHAAPVSDGAPGLAELTGITGSLAPNDLAEPGSFASAVADFNDADSNSDLALRVFPISGGGYWLTGRHAGNTSILPPYPTLTVAKYRADGSFDTSYNGTGKKSFDTPMSFIVDVARGAGDTLYALGSYTAPGFTDSDFGVYCVDADGDPCAGFGSNGFVSVALDLGAGAARHGDYPSRITYAFSSLYLAGSSDTGSGTTSNLAIAVVKMSSTSGSVDGGFGDDINHPGVFHYNLDFLANGNDSIADLIAYAPAPFQVKLVMVGATQRAQLAGEDTDGFIGAIDGLSGQIDPLFSGTGFQAVAVDLGGDHKDGLDRVIRRANGGFVAAGRAKDSNASPAHYELVLAAFRADGSTDTSFANSGLYHDLVVSGTNRPFGLAERAQNRDLVVGINILDDLFGDSHPLQAVVQFGSSARVRHALAFQDFAGTPKNSTGEDLVLDNNVVATAGYRRWDQSIGDYDMTIVRYVATDSIFADRFGGSSSD
ncbi:MAG: hypothetical protein ABIR62_01700 [Dokdonella sp.]|uniref:hypothetical protein n=1 Tax=Dokdonella sp. TaxID=2291710 RepID=UPI0032672A74